MNHYRVATGSSTSQVSVWDISKQAPAIEFHHHEDGIVNLAIASENDHILMACGLDGRLTITDIRESSSKPPCLQILDQRGHLSNDCCPSYFTQACFLDGVGSILTATVGSE